MLELHECKSVTNLHQGHLNESRREDHERASSYKLDDLFLPQKICTTFLQEFHLSLVWNFWNGSMRYVRVSVKEDSKRFKIILKTGSRVKTCKRESIVLSDRYYRMDSCSSKGDNNRAKRHYPSPPLLLSISKRIGSRATIPGNPITRNEIYPNFQSIEHRFDYYPPDLWQLDDQIEPIATKIGRVPSQLPSTMPPPTNPFFRFESIKLCPPPPPQKKISIEIHPSNTLYIG